jgi:hypothetical protein
MELTDSCSICSMGASIWTRWRSLRLWAVDLLAVELDLVAGALNLAAAVELVAISLVIALDRPR